MNTRKPAPKRAEPRKPRSVPILPEPPLAEETLSEAEEEIGIHDWLDPDTGEPAEGQAPPHLVDE